MAAPIESPCRNLCSLDAERKGERFVGNSCRHIPTCSEYGYESIARHGLWAGGWMTLFRVGRCGPGGTSGLDQVPETLSDDFPWWTPWRYLTLGRKRG